MPFGDQSQQGDEQASDQMAFEDDQIAVENEQDSHSHPQRADSDPVDDTKLAGGGEGGSANESQKDSFSTDFGAEHF